MMLISPPVVQQLADADIQFANLDVSTWGEHNTTIEYGYDDNGSLTSKVTSVTSTQQVLEAVTYVYNLQGRLSKVTTDTGTVSVAEYKYDPDGNRVAKIEDGVTTSYLIDNYNHTGYSQVFVETRDTSPEPQVTSYIIGDDVL